MLLLPGLFLNPRFFMMPQALGQGEDKRPGLQPPSAAAAASPGAPLAPATAPGKLQPAMPLTNGVGSGKKRKALEAAGVKAGDSAAQNPRSKR